MAREDEIIKERMKKISEMRKSKIEPFSYRFDKKDNCANLQEEYKARIKDENTSNV